MRIGILEAGHLPEELAHIHPRYRDIYARMLDGHGFEVDGYSVVDMEFPKDIHAADGWLISGSRHGAYEDHPWIPPLEAFLCEAYAANVPLVGVCFGHQILAQALGGKVVKHDNGWVVGATDYDFEGAPIRLNAWHQDQVVDLPPDARVLGSSETCRYAMLGYGDKAFSVQAHPEFEADFIEGLLRHRARGVVPDALIDHAMETLESPAGNPVFAQRISDFFKLKRA